MSQEFLGLLVGLNPAHVEADAIIGSLIAGHTAQGAVGARQPDRIAHRHDLGIAQFLISLQGVKDVWNEMTVSKTSKNTGRTGIEKIDDPSITAQVKLSLLWHRSTSVLRTRVDTMHGVVTLSGKAANTAEIDLVSKLVTDIKGVKSVHNRLTIEESK